MKTNKIAYIILTCEKYLNSRVKWQVKSCFKYINKSDCYYISCIPHIFKYSRIYGWNTKDDYKSCPDKYIAFLKNLNLNYDWYVFIDDDTFVYPNRLENFLDNFNKTNHLYIGYLLTHLRELNYMSGGAGFVISHPTYLLIKNFINNSCINYIQHKYYEQIYGDVSFGIWIKLINEMLLTEKKEPIQLVGNLNFQPNIHNNVEQLNECITFHYVNSKEQFEFYEQFMIKPKLELPYYIYIISAFCWFVFISIFQKLFNYIVNKSCSLNICK
jgi:hypothetical protein